MASSKKIQNDHFEEPEKDLADEQMEDIIDPSDIYYNDKDAELGIMDEQLEMDEWERNNNDGWPDI